MTFQEFLLEKRIVNFVGSLEQMEINEAVEVLETLDQETIDIIESYLGEGIMSHLKKHGKAYVGAGTIGLAGLLGAKMLKGPEAAKKEPTRVKHVEPKANVKAAVNYTGVSSDNDDD